MRSKRTFSDFFKAYLDYTDGHESTERMRLWTSISIVAAALERKVWLPRGYYTLFPNMYIFIVGKSGLVKKSTSTAIGVNILREVEEIDVMSERITAAALIQQLSESQKSFEYDGCDIKQAASYIYASELHVFLGEVYGSTIELLTTFYDCVPHDSNKPWVNKTKNAGVDVIYGPCLNMLGASTLSWLRKSLPITEMEGGFASRIIFVVEPNAPSKFIAWPTLNGKERMREDLIGDMEIIANLKGPMVFDKEAKDLFEDWYLRHMKQEQGEWSDSKFCGYMGRKGDHILKLAMVRSVSLRSNLEPVASDVEWAIDALQKLEGDMFMLFKHDRIDGSPGDPNNIKKQRKTVNKTASGNAAYHIREFLKRVKIAPLSTIRDNMIEFTTAENINLALSELVDMSYLVTSEKHGVVFYSTNEMPQETTNEYDL